MVLTDAERLRLRKFHREVVDHTIHARKRWEATPNSLERDESPIGDYFLVFVEELGKLARTYNKLDIVVDPKIRKEWQIERDHRLVTCSSMLDRIALEFWRLDRQV